jgi:hypothetical protein
MARLRPSIALLVALAAPPAGCARSRSIALRIGGPAQYSGFTCVVDAAGRAPLIGRAIARGEVTFIADFLGVPINVNAAGDVLLRACSGGQCTPLAGRRSAFTVRASELSYTPGSGDEALGRAIASALARWQITENAPDGRMILRVVATTEDGASLARADANGRYPGFSPAQLVGCAITPATEFDVTEGPIYLSLPVFDDPCLLAQVSLCANGR